MVVIGRISKLDIVEASILACDISACGRMAIPRAFKLPVAIRPEFSVPVREFRNKRRTAVGAFNVAPVFFPQLSFLKRKVQGVCERTGLSVEPAEKKTQPAR